ncbi:MAG: FtsW/RodA/SpoVE family cell cycle protein [Tissierellia bacterium]|nr:FtsW/RodA/SpoVE family cell cycle protein [Tissierellia bacterium]
MEYKINTKRLKEIMFKDLDYIFFLTIVFSVVYGLVILKSATLTIDRGESILRSQIMATALGIIAMIILTIVDYRLWKNFYRLIYGLCIAVLIATLIFGIGDKTHGARSWLKIGGFVFQPAEFVKLGLIISLSAYIEENVDDIQNPLTVIKLAIFAFVPVFLILIQPDFGTAMVFVFFIFVMFFAVGLDIRYFLAVIIPGILALPLIWMKLEPYQKNRFLVLFKTEELSQSWAYQLNEGIIAIGSGKFFGKGLGKGSQTQFNFIPKKYNDSIFPVVAEELGFLGAGGLIVLYGIMLYRMVKVSKESPDTFGQMMVIGFVAVLFFHIFEAIGMTLGILPMTGIPLPFFSQGGTFQLTNLAIAGLVLSVSLHRSQIYYY